MTYLKLFFDLQLEGGATPGLSEPVVRDVPIKINSFAIKETELVEGQSEDDAVSTSTNTSGYTSISTSNSMSTDTTER